MEEASVGKRLQRRQQSKFLNGGADRQQDWRSKYAQA